jgi:hypothetical protein
MAGVIILVKCDCCDMQFWRREVTCYPNSMLFYNRKHFLRYWSTKIKHKPLTAEDLACEDCTEPGRLVVWREEDELPYSLCTK